MSTGRDGGHLGRGTRSNNRAQRSRGERAQGIQGAGFAGGRKQLVNASLATVRDVDIPRGGREPWEEGRS